MVMCQIFYALAKLTDWHMCLQKATFPKLGYRFNNPNLLKTALTHRSHGMDNYERLEFLGDALLGAIITRALFGCHQDKPEGALTRMRAGLVNENALFAIAQKLAIAPYVVIGLGEKKSGGVKPSMLADVVEALIGAMYLDGLNFDDLSRIVLSWYGDLIQNAADVRALKDAKSRLQEWAQGRGIMRPEYRASVCESGFLVACSLTLNGKTHTITQTGESKKTAEQKCAELMINRLNSMEEA